MPSNYAKEIIANHAPRFSTMFGISWNLFTPPFTYNNRLYYIVRNTGRPDRSDTIEVLENISLQKQTTAPFNQKENIIDHLVNNNVSRLTKTIWLNKKKPQESEPGTTDSAYIASAIAEVANSKNYLIFLTTLNNYCKVALKENKIDTAGKEVKTVIKEKMIRPFKEMYNTNFVQKETLVFETPFKPVH